MANPARDTLIKFYFDLGMLYKDITSTLALRHNILISERHLKRELRTLNLFRRSYSNLGDVADFVTSQLLRSGQLHGYRVMHAKCLQNGLRVRKEDVRLILKELDPEGVDLRRRRVLHRRAYYARGPNYIWHVDGYDKLKPYGLCINGCIDGYSRMLIWLNLYHTNSNPRLIGGYFVEGMWWMSIYSPCRPRMAASVTSKKIFCQIWKDPTLKAEAQRISASKRSGVSCGKNVHNSVHPWSNGIDFAYWNDQTLYEFRNSVY